MSAHLCLTAWKEPMGRPNWNRVLAYPALISRHLRAPPACSAAERHAGQVEHPAHQPARLAFGADEDRGHLVEGQGRHRPGGIERGHRLGAQSGRAAVHREQGRPGGAAGHDQHQVRDRPVDDEALLPAQRPPRPRCARPGPRPWPGPTTRCLPPRPAWRWSARRRCRAGTARRPPRPPRRAAPGRRAPPWRRRASTAARPPSPPAPPRARSGRTRRRRTRWAAPGPAA